MAYFDKYGVEFSDDRKTLVKCPTDFKGEYVIPDGVTSVGWSAFYCCTGLTSVTIPNSVTRIEVNAFSGCTGLISVSIPNSVTSIEESAFCEVPNIIYSGLATGSPWEAKSINGYVEGYLIYSDKSKTRLLACSTSAVGAIIIPNSVTSIGIHAFEQCTNLTSVTIGSNVRIIGYRAFSGCTGLTSVTIPNSVTSIRELAFEDVPTIVFSGYATGSPWGAKSINGYVEGYLIYDDKSKTRVLSCSTVVEGEIIIPNSVTSIGYSAFRGCKGLTSVIIPDSVTSIGDCAFWDCSSLTSIIIPSCVTSIGNCAFYGCIGLSKIVVPKGSIERFCAMNGLKDYAEIIRKTSQVFLR